MTRSAFLAPCLVFAALLPSCAYMQTHKNVKEMGQRYEGHQLDKPRQLFHSQGSWFVAAIPAVYQKSHDVIHDNVFRKSHEPEMVMTSSPAVSPVFHQISQDTAAVLLRPDGYADNTTLAREISESSAPWLASLPQATVHPVRAMIAGVDAASVTDKPTPEEVPLTYRILSGLDFVLVDVPGTVVYNVAVPIMAPFVFFHEFLNEP